MFFFAFRDGDKLLSLLQSKRYVNLPFAKEISQEEFESLGGRIRIEEEFDEESE